LLVVTNVLRGPRERTSLRIVRVALLVPLGSFEIVLRLATVLRIVPRGLFGRSFQHATVPLPVPSWTPADRLKRPRPGAIRPTPIKSIRSSCGTPSRSIIVFTPGRDGQVKGTSRAGREPQGFARRKAANQHRHISRSFVSVMGSWMVYLRNLMRRIGQRWEPTPAPRSGLARGMRVGQKVHPCSFHALLQFLFELHALNPSGARGTPPEKHCL